MNEPCRILMTFSTPQTSEKPAAMHAYRPPSTRPFASIWSESRLLHAQPELALADALRMKHQRFPVLDLEHRRLQRVDLPGRPELHVSPEGDFVHRGERVAHFLLVERAGLFDRQLEDRAGGRGGSL